MSVINKIIKRFKPKKKKRESFGENECCIEGCGNRGRYTLVVGGVTYSFCRKHLQEFVTRGGIYIELVLEDGVVFARRGVIKPVAEKMGHLIVQDAIIALFDKIGTDDKPLKQGKY